MASIMKRFIPFVCLFILTCTVSFAGDKAAKEPQQESPETPAPAEPAKQEAAPLPKAPVMDDETSEDGELKPQATHEWDMNQQYKAAFMKTILIIIAIIFGVFIVIWLLRRMAGSRSMVSNHYKNIKVLERRHLSPQTMLYQVEIGGRQVLIAESKVHVSTLTEFDVLDKGKEL